MTQTTTGAKAGTGADPLAAPARLAERYLGALRRRHPEATPAQILYLVDKQFALAMSVGGTTTGLLALPRRGPGALWGISAAHLGACAAVSTLYLLCLARVHGLDPAATRALVTSCALGETEGGVLEEHFAGTWWRTALAYLPVSQVRFVDRVAAQSLRRARRRGEVSRSAAGLPAGIGATMGFASGRVLAGRVARAAAGHLGRPPAHFPGAAAERNLP